MKKILYIAFLIILVSGARVYMIAFNSKLGVESSYVVTSTPIKMSITDVTNKKLKLTLENTSDETYRYELPYTIEKKYKGKWYTVEPKNFLVFSDILSDLNSGDIVSMDLDFSKGYGTLKPGVYRLIKKVFRVSGGNAYIASEFKVS